MYSKGLFWFRRDLRLEDNAALYSTCKNCAELSFVFVFDENILNKLINKNDKRLTFIWQSICCLKTELEKKGASLYLLYGDPVIEIPKLAKNLKAECVFANRDYEKYALERDEKVQAHLNENEINFLSQKDQIIFELPEVLKPDRKPYIVFTPYKKAWLKNLLTRSEFYLTAYPSQDYLNKKQFTPKLASINQLQSLEQIGFQENKNLILQGGFLSAEKTFEQFIEQRIFSYKETRDFLEPNSTSNLSVHLRFGNISIRKCFRTAWNLMLSHKLIIKENIETWLSELIWREFYSSILQAFSGIEKQEFKTEYQNLPWKKDEKLLQAWINGQTGYPIIDAAMRQLKATGQMPNRLRMIVASFLCKDLLLDWRFGQAHFANYLLDFDLASNNGGWQWAASTGVDAVPYFRIFNPTLQSEKFDPKAKYIKTYIPELNNIEAKDIHNMTFLIPDYPAPIVNHKEAKQKAIEFFKMHLKPNASEIRLA